MIEEPIKSRIPIIHRYNRTSMKLSHIAQALTLALVAVTAWLAYQAQKESASTTAKLEQFTQQQQKAITAQAEASAALIPGLATPLASPATAGSLPPLPQVTTPTPAATKPEANPLDIVPPPLPGPMPAPGSAKKVEAPAPASPPAPAVASTPAPATSAPAGTPAAPPAPPSAGTAGGPAPALAPPPTAPLFTPLQRRIKDSPALAKVKEAVADQGFVTLDAGTKAGLKQGLKFDLRRDAAVVGRVTISVVEDSEAVADIDPRSVPAGMTVQAGDELISVVLDR